MWESNHGGATVLILTLSAFTLHCAPLTPPATSDLFENKIFSREPLSHRDLEKVSKKQGKVWGLNNESSSRFAPKTFLIFPAVPPKTFPVTLAHTEEPLRGDETDGNLVAKELVPVTDLQETIQRIQTPVAAYADHSPVVANVVASLNQTINKIELNQLSTEGVRKIFSEIISAVSKLLPEDLSSNSGPAMTAADVGDNEKHEKQKELENENEVEIDLADGLSIFAGWPNICKLLWFATLSITITEKGKLLQQIFVTVLILDLFIIFRGITSNSL